MLDRDSKFQKENKQGKKINIDKKVNDLVEKLDISEFDFRSILMISYHPRLYLSPNFHGQIATL